MDNNAKMKRIKDINMKKLEYRNVQISASGIIDNYEIKWLIENAEKYLQLEQAWLEGKKDSEYQVVHYLRVCKEVIEGTKTEYRGKPMS